MKISEKARVIIIRSSERFLIDEARKEIIHKLTEGNTATAYVKYFSARTTGPDDIIEICRTRPMISRRVVIVLDDAEKSRGDALKKYARYAERPSGHAWLILLWNDSRGNNEFEESVKTGGGQVIALSSLKPSQLPAWIRRQVLRRGKRITPGAIETLLQLASPDMSVLNGELEKLILFAHDKKEITEEDVFAACSPQMSYGIFDLVDNIAGGNVAEALRILRHLMDAGESAAALVALMARHFRLLWQVKDFLKDRPAEPKTIAREINLPPFVVKKLIGQSRNFPERTLRQIHAMLYMADRDIKSLGIPPIYILERVILEGLYKNKTGTALHGRSPYLLKD